MKEAAAGRGGETSSHQRREKRSQWHDACFAASLEHAITTTNLPLQLHCFSWAASCRTRLSSFDGPMPSHLFSTCLSFSVYMYPVKLVDSWFTCCLDLDIIFSTLNTSYFEVFALIVPLVTMCLLFLLNLAKHFLTRQNDSPYYGSSFLLSLVIPFMSRLLEEHTHAVCSNKTSQFNPPSPKLMASLA